MTDSTTVLRTVTIRLFAAAKDRAGTETITVQAPAAACFGELRNALSEALPELRPLVRHLLFAVGTEYAADDAVVPASGEIIAFPPVSGG